MKITNKTRIGRMNTNSTQNTNQKKFTSNNSNKNYVSRDQITSKQASSTGKTKPTNVIKVKNCVICTKPGHIQKKGLNKKNINNISEETEEITEDITEETNSYNEEEEQYNESSEDVEDQYIDYF